MWCLETIKQINQKHAELGRGGAPVSAAQVYAECGIRVLGNSPKAGTTLPPEVELNIESEEISVKDESRRTIQIDGRNTRPNGEEWLMDNLPPGKQEALRIRARELREADDEI